jgi:glycosyltransferase involved in cell wall biosynthesis/GT2 family glycosyltransferase
LTNVRLSVVVASKDRVDLLARMLQSLRPQLAPFGAEAEIIVVDDGSQPPYEQTRLAGVTLIVGDGRGPARARNRGVALATGAVVAFVDDDIVVESDWVTTLLHYLDTHPDVAGVTGDTTAPPHDPLREHAVQDHVGGSYLTCNIAYRRSALELVGGFDESFAHAHEDRDLAWRVTALVGTVGVEPAMRVVHPGRPFRARDAWRRANFIYDDWLLFSRYPDRKKSRWSVRWAPVANTARTWRDVGRTEAAWRRPATLARLMWVGGGQLLCASWLALTRWRAMADRPTAPAPGLTLTGWRIAYVGPSPDPAAGGAPGVAGLLLAELLDRGHQVDVYVAASVEDDDPRGLGERVGLRYVIGRSNFAFGRWYSNSRVTKMMSSQLFAAVNRRRLARRLAGRHDATPYDFVYQFSTFESFGVPRRKDLPVFIHPSVHAKGEQRWVRQEARLGVSDDGVLRTTVVIGWLALRSLRQRRDARRATGILALSRSFGALVQQDYRVDASRVRVVPNCIDLSALTIGESLSRELVVVGRLVVRKGLEDVVALTHRLDAIDGTVRVRIIGAPSLWSDYRRVLRQCVPAFTTIDGPLSRAQVANKLRGSLALLQLSRYEPFGLTVAEALGSGVPVIVTPAVGAAEDVANDVKYVVAPGDLDALAAAVRSMSELRDDERVLLAHRCRHEAERLFAPSVVADRLVDAITELLG